MAFAVQIRQKSAVGNVKVWTAVKNPRRISEAVKLRDELRDCGMEVRAVEAVRGRLKRVLK